MHALRINLSIITKNKLYKCCILQWDFKLNSGCQSKFDCKFNPNADLIRIVFIDTKQVAKLVQIRSENKFSLNFSHFHASFSSDHSLKLKRTFVITSWTQLLFNPPESTSKWRDDHRWNWLGIKTTQIALNWWNGATRWILLRWQVTQVRETTKPTDHFDVLSSNFGFAL